MANVLYNAGKIAILNGAIGDQRSADLRFALVNTTSEVFNAADAFMSDITSPVARMAASLASKTTNTPVAGTLDAADPTINSVTGSTVQAVVLYMYQRERCRCAAIGMDRLDTIDQLHTERLQRHASARCERHLLDLMSPVLPTAGQRPYDLNSWLLVGHDVNGNNLPGASDATKVDKDSVVVAATRILASKLLAGDAQAAFQIQGDGTHRWGPGGATAFDSHLYRSAASVLTVQASVIVTGNHNTSYSVGVDQANGGGGLYFGSASDVILLRTGASQLQLSGNLKATGNVFGTQYVAAFGAFADAQAQMMFHANYAGAGFPAVRWGPGGAAALDCDLYRSGPAQLVTGGSLVVGGGLSANSLITGNYSTAFQAASNASGAVALNAASLPNNGYLFSMKQLGDAGWRLLATSAGQLIFSDGAGSASANLYWKSASALGTDTNFYAGGEIRANNGGVSTQIYLGGDGKIYFGTAGDTNVYRSGASKLRTDGTLDANALTINGVPIGSVPTGAMFDWPIAAAPTGFLLCDGSAVSRTTYAALFTLLGSTYGGGDGSTTFNLPDFRGPRGGRPRYQRRCERSCQERRGCGCGPHTEAQSHVCSHTAKPRPLDHRSSALAYADG